MNFIKILNPTSHPVMKRVKIDERTHSSKSLNLAQHCVCVDSNGDPSAVFIPEILVIIFNYLEEPSDLCSCSLVCRSWRANVWSSVTRLLLDKPYTINRIQDKHLEFFAANCPRVRHLNVLYCRHITDLGVKYISQMKPLRDLLLAGCDLITDAGLYHLKHLKHLERLYLSLCFRITDTGLGFLMPLPNLKELFLCGCDMLTDHGISRYLTKIKTLEEIVLSGCPRISDGSFGSFKALENLKSLNLMCCGITDRTLESLGKVKSLEKLNLSGCVQITDAGLENLVDLQFLSELNVMYCPRLTSAGKATLAKIQSLQKLQIS